MTFTSPISLCIAVLIAMALFIVAWIRRPALPRLSYLLAGCGMVCLALAAGGISCRRGHEPRVAVMVDCSPSTRGASFRDARWVRSRARQLLGNRDYQLYAFADSTTRLQDDEPLAEMPARWTALSPPAVDAVVLFSDGRCDVPAVMPPIYPVIDPALNDPVDAAVVDLEMRGNELTADVRNRGAARALTWEDRQRHSTTAPSGLTVISTNLSSSTETLTARLSSGDPWPENDALSIRPSPPIHSQVWWVGDAPPAGWMQMSPANLPLESSAWLGPAIVVLNNIPAGSLSSQQQDRLTQYVRDLGGALVIGGGDRAFAAGHYPGSALESLSPLSSSPPEPVNHWVLLVDSSGSMSAQAGNATRFRVAADALVSVLRELPRSDLVSIGSFARELNWWSVAKEVQDTAILKLPPANVEPTGPTNLEDALREIVEKLPTSPPIELLVLTDAQAKFADAAKLATELKDHHIRVNALLIGASSPDSPLHRIVRLTGGQLAEESEPQKWTQSVRRMLRAAMPDDLIHEPATIHFSSLLQSLPPRSITLMNRTWMKQSATLVAEAGKVPAAACWNVGTGQALALAFAPDSNEITAIDRAIARKPRDPRFKIRWRNRAQRHVRIDAMDRGDYMNGLQLSLEMNPGTRQPIPQTAPGRYEIDLPSPRVATTATILRQDQALDRFALAGRYAREFDAVGNDLEALSAIADRSGGAVIEPARQTPLDLPETQRVVSVAGVMAVVGFVLIAGALVAWRGR